MADDIEWSESTTTLRDIANTVSFPCVVRVCEGYESGDEITSFSLGDLIKIDSCEVIKKILGGFVDWVAKSGDTIGKYVKLRGEDISIPVSYKGCVRVLPKHGAYHVYSDVGEILADFPRYVEVLDHIVSFTNDGVATTIKKGEVIETVGWKKPKDKSQASSLKCRRNENETLQILSTTRGRFRVLRDDMEYTLQEVIQRFPLPQIVQFAEQIYKEQISTDIKEAINNLDNFEGKIMLEKVYSEQILFGHYKSLHSDPAAARFLKRTAIMIPLSIPDLEEITVQYPLYMDSTDYEFFVTKNFRDTQAGRQLMDRALYVEFTKKSHMRFTEIEDPALNKPQDEDENTPPPRPPRRDMSKVQHANPASKTTPVKEEVKLPLPSKNNTETLSRQESFNIFSDQGGILSDIDWGASGGSMSKLTDDMKLKKSMEGMKAKVKGLFKKPAKSPVQISRPAEEEQDDSSSIYEFGNEDVDSDYDYPDLSKEIPLKDNKGGGYLTAVRDKMKITKSPRGHQKKFHELTVEELENRFVKCGLNDLSRICHREAYDGKIFSKLSDAVLQSKPFNLTSLEIFKLNEIKDGWTPTFSNDS